MPSNASQKLAFSLLAVLLSAAASGCGREMSNIAPVPGTGGVDVVRRGPGGVTRFMARNLLYRLDRNVSMFLSEMNADILNKDPNAPFIPANKSDFRIVIHRAVVSKGAADLESLMNTYVFNDAESPIRDLRIAFKNGRLVMGGKMKKGIWVGFEMEGDLEPTTDGKIRLIPRVIKSLGLRVDGLLNLIGLEMAKLLKMREEKGLVLNGNELVMDMSKLLPPPQLMGRVVGVSIQNNAMRIEMDDGKARPWPEDLPFPQARSTLLMWGGDVLINSVLNINAKMQVLDGSPQTPMVFALERYREQLEAGIVTPTRSGHLIAFVPDVLNYDGDMGRYAPPGLVVPGLREGPSDLRPGSGGVQGLKSARQEKTSVSAAAFEREYPQKKGEGKQPPL
ncbi:MAG: hypothetical protein VKN33_08940 [Candidatus Sericytochromatia bacterium]|nr:hypothetical protein [Candidatus Sericytochromatia bacterium]